MSRCRHEDNLRLFVNKELTALSSKFTPLSCHLCTHLLHLLLFGVVLSACKHISNFACLCVCRNQTELNKLSAGEGFFFYPEEKALCIF